MFGRKIESKLRDWRSSVVRKPLILRGARQVGKTSIVRKFAEENFDNFLEINLENKDQKEYFGEAKNVDDFVKRVEFFTKKKITEGKTLLFIDEIQESVDSLNLLRFFAEEKPNLHLIAAGSLLEAKMYGKWNVPVGRVEYMYLYPMTFFEFLGAIGQEQLADDPKTTHSLLVKHLIDYLLVGGMPEAVLSFVNDGGFATVQEVHERLTVSYAEDIDKYASPTERKYLQLIMNFGPKIAGSVYKYENFGDSEYRSREVREAINLLQRVMLLREVPSINSINLPFVLKLKRAKKMVWLDVGIVNFTNNAQFDLLKGEYGGKSMEQFVGQTLVAGGFRRGVELVYWSRNKDEGSAEVDFCFQHGNKIVGLEVKSGNTKNLKSLFSMIDIGGDKVIPVRVSWDQFGVERYKYSGKEYKILSIPFYLLERVEKFLI